jgi:hypothetical protein
MLFNCSSNNTVSKYFSFLVNKKGDTKIRKILSYLIIVLVSTTMSANLVFITAKLTDTDITFPIKKVEQPIQQVINSNEAENFIINTQTAEIKPSEIDNVKLVDFMKNSGIVDTSFDSRARLALKFGIVDKLEDYKGTLSQNMSIIKTMNEGRMVLTSN